MTGLYNIILHAALLVCLPVLPFLYIFSAKRRHTLLHRFGFSDRCCPGKGPEKRIWVHALSVGEVKSALPLIKALKSTRPLLSIVFTASTKTGYDTACQLFQTDTLQVDQIGYFPYDFPFSIHKILKQVAPDLVCIIETDLWPNFLRILDRKKIPVVLLNARLSERSFKGYHRFKSFFTMTFSKFALIFVQTPQDKNRFEALGIPPGKIEITGNIKFDQPVPVPDAGESKRLADHLGISSKTVVIIAGSTHEGEEKMIADVVRKLDSSQEPLKLIIAPRDPGRAVTLKSLFEFKTRKPVLYSQIDDTRQESDVILVDTMGILARLYSFADLVFIGGSLVPQGGHNPLEPAAVSRPVLFGPHMSDFSLISEKLIQCGGAMMVPSAHDLFDQIQLLLHDPEKRKQMGQQARLFYCENKGAVKRCLNRMEADHFI